MRPHTYIRCLKTLHWSVCIYRILHDVIIFVPHFGRDKGTIAPLTGLSLYACILSGAGKTCPSLQQTLPLGEKWSSTMTIRITLFIFLRLCHGQSLYCLFDDPIIVSKNSWDAAACYVTVTRINKHFKWQRHPQTGSLCTRKKKLRKGVKLGLKNQFICRFANHNMYAWPSKPLYYNAATLIYTQIVRWRDFTVSLEFLRIKKSLEFPHKKLPSLG